nr:MAG TPA: Integrase [Caudoviricetes sp.]
MKIPKATKLPSGSWRVNVMIDGKRISITAPTKKDVEKEAAAMKSGAKYARAKTDLTVGEAIDRYIESKDSVLSPSTVAGYRRIRKNAFPELMGTPLDKLTPQAVQRAVNSMAKDKSPKSVRNAHGLLSATLADYRPDMALRTTMPQKQRYDIAIPSGEDVEKILDAVQGTPDELAILLAIWLGLRMSEILGLKWQDIDGDVLHIRRALVDEGEKTTKTYSSQRNLLIPEYIKGLFDVAPHTSEHIVPISRRALYCRFQALCRKAGVQHYRFHDLRHINASVMLALNVPNRYAQERMGHATDNMLKTVYQHTMAAEQIAVAQKVDQYFTSKLHTELHTKA